ncbi:unnamed protein product [Miscanthus lutarioriparius]|uniref:AP2/ERF domain-containing protein n=1 Tax=Miscanthus lutarioriparius TaxID=422564 RepID=A0A811MRV2_9POAL|nr:unnamed protein product [Miscanthus lutarioriparius]
MAAAAYDAAALALRGAGTALNFPDAAMSRPAPASASAEDVRAAAAAAAAAMADFGQPPRKRSGSRHDELHGHSGGGGGAGVVDEDDLFEMPRLMLSMAEGLMMSPPVLGPAAAAMEADEEGVSLWDHS